MSKEEIGMTFHETEVLVLRMKQLQRGIEGAPSEVSFGDFGKEFGDLVPFLESKKRFPFVTFAPFVAKWIGLARAIEGEHDVPLDAVRFARQANGGGARLWVYGSKSKAWCEVPPEAKKASALLDRREELERQLDEERRSLESCEAELRQNGLMLAAMGWKWKLAGLVRRKLKRWFRAGR